MAAYKLMTINVGNGQEDHAGSQERIEAAKTIIEEHQPDIVFLQDLASERGLKKLQLGETYLYVELPHTRSKPYTSVLWKKDTVSTWKRKKNASKEKLRCERNIVQDRFTSVYLAGPKGEKLCVVSYQGFDKKPKFHGQGNFTVGEKKKLTRDLLDYLKSLPSADAVIIGGSFELPANETPRQGVFQKAQSIQTADKFFMFNLKDRKQPLVNIGDVKTIQIKDEQKALKHAPISATLQMMA